MDWQVSKMHIRFVRDDQKVFVLDASIKTDAAWGIKNIAGVSSIDNVISTKDAAYGDGDEFLSERIPARNIDIVASVKDRRRNQEERAAAIKFFLAKHTYTLYITIGGVTRWITARLQRFKCNSVPGDQHVNMDLALKCEDPFFNSVDNFGKNIAGVIPMFSFPYKSSVKEGFLVGLFNFSREITIDNTGDVNTNMKIIIEADGDVEKPRIICGDSYIKINDTMKLRDQIEIDLTKNTIKKNGVNCIGKVDRLSNFTGMELVVGENTISFDAENGDTKMNVYLYYNLKYMEV